jgi:hypothetical protein
VVEPFHHNCKEILLYSLEIRPLFSPSIIIICFSLPLKSVTMESDFGIKVKDIDRLDQIIGMDKYSLLFLCFHLYLYPIYY